MYKPGMIEQRFWDWKERNKEMAIAESKGHWNRHIVNDNSRWGIEMSDIQNNSDQQRCPQCQRPLEFGYRHGQLAPVIIGGGIQYWKGSCTCGTQLIIFND